MKISITKEALLGGFIGGMTISLLELATTIKSGDYSLVSVFFFIGCLASGVVGVIGTLVVAPGDFRNAISAGIAAPSLLGGLIQSGVATTTAALLLSIASPAAYADDSIPIVSDSSIVVVIDSTDALEVEQVEQADQEHPLKHIMRAFGVK